jgi:hypothetical protein
MIDIYFAYFERMVEKINYIIFLKIMLCFRRSENFFPINKNKNSIEMYKNFNKIGI